MKTPHAATGLLGRGSFLQRSLTAGGAPVLPQIVPGRVLGRDDGVAPSNRVVMARFAIGRRGGSDLSVMIHEPDVQFVAIADVRAERRQAIKNMYGEKPCSTNIAASLALAETMRRYSRVYQAGTQRRNVSNFAFACELARSGKLGRLRTVHANTLSPGTKLDWLPAEPEPPRDGDAEANRMRARGKREPWHV